MFFRSIRMSAAIAVVCFSSTPSFADDREHLFSCAIEDAAFDFISLYAVRHVGGVGVDLEFSVERHGIITMQFPDESLPGDKKFYFSNSLGPEGYYAQVRFGQGGRYYLLHMLDIPPVAGDTNDMGGRAAGLTVIEPNGTRFELGCGETVEYIGLMQEVMACDTANRYGAAGCEFGKPPKRDLNDRLPPGYAPS